jgi:hypothetical protein
LFLPKPTIHHHQILLSFFDKFSHKAAERSTPGSPCTNQPKHCQAPKCSKTDPLWLYNMQDHILAVHGQRTYNGILNKGQFMVSNAEIWNLQLDKLLVLPSRQVVTLPLAPLHKAGQPVEELLSAHGGFSRTQVDLCCRHGLLRPVTGGCMLAQPRSGGSRCNHTLSDKGY